MPRYFKSKAEQLHCEAFASFVLIEQICAENVINGIIPDKLCKIYEKAQARVSRRWYALHK